jgi:hypothetical protein
LLLTAAVSLVFYNRSENEKSGEAAQSVLVELAEVIPPPPPTEPKTEIPTAADIFAEYDIEPTTVPKEETTVVIADSICVIKLCKVMLTRTDIKINIIFVNTNRSVITNHIKFSFISERPKKSLEFFRAPVVVF